ncbi:MAG: sulfur carrier protein ThiS [Candidatus Heimdallarchaeaceae archaeon]
MTHSRSSASLTIEVQKPITVEELLEKYQLKSTGILVVINGNLVTNPKATIQPSDKVLILPAVAGG